MRHYENTCRHAEFPLGGIGTGTITLNASGRLTDLQVFNHPDLGMVAPYTFFSMYSKLGDKTDARSLAAQSEPDFYKGRGYHASRVMGTPCFPKSEMTVKYPFADIRFEDDSLPLRVSLRAFTPFIPGKADDSGIPGAVFRYEVENLSGEEAEVLVVSSMGNIHNLHGMDWFDNVLQTRNGLHEARQEKGLTGVFMTGDDAAEDSLTFANNAIAALDDSAETRPYWFRGGWYDALTDFWNNLEQGILSRPDEGRAEGALGGSGGFVGSVGIRKKIPAGKKASFTFLMTWYAPNRVLGWFEHDAAGRTMKNYYASLYQDAWQVAKDLAARLPELEEGSRRFSEALYASDLPEAMLDAVASNIAVLRSNTCWRAPDGTFMAWEGCHEHWGSCHGTCTHVWNYAQTVASLFPELEKSSRLNEFLIETDEEGKMTFRNQQKFGLKKWDFYPAIDGQFGTIIRAWREWTLTGDREYLKTVYPHVLRAFDYGMRVWDQDGDGVPDAKQHNTYDIEFYGPNPLSAVMELGAIRAVRNMAAEMADQERAEAMDALFAKAQKRFIELCWQGEYSRQISEDINKYPYQFGEGCLSDQLFGQTMAFLSGLGALLPEEQLKSAAQAIFRYNFLPGDRRDPCLQRLYVADDEDGLVLCSWPNGGKPRFPFVYSDEVWTGIEYHVATLLIYCGMEEEAQKIVEAARGRYDGNRRSPWSEMECGFYYTRAMASWGLLIAESGFECNVGREEFAFKPKKQGTYFWSTGNGWGNFCLGADKLEIRPACGEIRIGKLAVPEANRVCAVEHDGKNIPFEAWDGALYLKSECIGTDEALTVLYK